MLNEPAAQPAGIAGLSVRGLKPADFKSAVVQLLKYCVDGSHYYVSE